MFKASEYSGRLSTFYKHYRSSKIWYISDIELIGSHYFSYDKEIVYNFWSDYPDKLTDDQIRQFKVDNPIMAGLHPTSRGNGVKLMLMKTKKLFLEILYGEWKDRRPIRPRSYERSRLSY